MLDTQSANNTIDTRVVLGLHQLVGESPALINALRRIPVAASCDVTVLVTGETGTGKELVARAIHYQSPRHGKPFIPVNCSALPDHLFENEFFGHAKGAYTDASSATKGLIAEAEGGSLFLDEINLLSLSAQAKLLRFLQDREYRPLGSSSALVADVRIICATNAELDKNVQDGSFRQDLYFRLRSFPIHIPPLRERMDDIPLLVEHFINTYACQYNLHAKEISESALHKLLSYSWPGNVRELECIVQQAVLLSSRSVLEPEDISLPKSSHKSCNCLPLEDLKERALNQVERDYLVNVLSTHRGNITHAARATGKPRRSFQRLLRKYGIAREEFALSPN